MKKNEPELYNKILKKVYKGDEKRYQESQKIDIECKKEMIEESKKILKTKKYPHYMPLEYSKEFYEVMCSLTSGEHHAGIVKNHAVASSGIGDGGYSLKVAKEKGKNIAALISFINLEELK